jgi:hypothetical protein
VEGNGGLRHRGLYPAATRSADAARAEESMVEAGAKAQRRDTLERIAASDAGPRLAQLAPR